MDLRTAFLIFCSFCRFLVEPEKEFLKVLSVTKFPSVCKTVKTVFSSITGDVHMITVQGTQRMSWQKKNSRTQSHKENIFS